jgi:uncharacterized membrane protein
VTSLAPEIRRRLGQAPRSFVVAVVVMATLGTFGTAILVRAPCVASASDVEFPWCFSQFRELYFIESIGGGRLPYVDDCTPRLGEPCDEYPVLTMYAMRITGWMVPDGDLTAFYYVNTALMLLCAAVVAYLLAVRVGKRALYFAFAPTLLFYGLMNWDLVGVVFMAVGLEAFLRDRHRLAGIGFGLATATKLFPGLLLVPLAIDLLRRGRRGEAVRLTVAAVLTWVAVNAPFAILATEGWSTFFRFNSERQADIDSLWYSVCHRIVGDPGCIPTPVLNVASFAVFAGGAALVWWLKRRRDPGFEPWTLAFPLLVVFFLANKVYSPQYSLFLLPLIALLAPDLRLFVAFGLTELLIFITRYDRFPVAPPSLALELAVVARDVVLVAWVVVWILRSRPPFVSEDDRSDDQASSWAARSDGSETGSLQAKRSHT